MIRSFTSSVDSLIFNLFLKGQIRGRFGAAFGHSVSPRVRAVFDIRVVIFEF